PDDWAGKKGRCPSCSAVNLVPEPEPGRAPASRPRSYVSADRDRDYGPPRDRDRPPRDDEDRPRRRPRRAAEEGGPRALLAVFIGGGFLLLIAVVGASVGLYFAIKSAKRGPGGSSGTPPGWTRVNWSEGRCRFSMPRSPSDQSRAVAGDTLHIKILDQGDKA